MENKLDQLFRNQLSKYEENPSPKAWEQIHHQLTSKRRGLWAKRLAIAASFLLVATVGFFGYRSITNIETNNEHHVSQSVMDKEQLPDQPTAGNETLIPVETESTSQDRAEVEITDKRPVVEHQNEKISKVEINKKAGTEKKEMNKESNADLIKEPVEISEFEKEDRSVNEDIKQESPQNTEEATLPQVQTEELLVADNNTIEDIKKTNLTENKKKTYSEVKIVYKANDDSELVTSGKRSILNKGINKITEFSDEHLLTADRKSKLRNTTEDLLALNFGKLLNKSNKELEN